MFRGQSFDVFKLLIAAVIAVAILGILLAIIEQIIPPGQEAVNVAKQQLNSALLSPCAPLPSDTVSFKAGEGWVKASFEMGTGQRISSLVTLCEQSLIDNELFECNEGATLSRTLKDFSGGISAQCDSEGNCALLVYRNVASAPEINSANAPLIQC